MNCPNCNSPKTKVIETRKSADGLKIKRRRECLSCEFRATSEESFVESLIWVRKKKGERELFSSDKIRLGISAACQKRPVSKAQIEFLVTHTTQWAKSYKSNTIPTIELGIHITEQLKEIDEIASIRFISVHKSFDDVGSFVHHLSNHYEVKEREIYEN